MYLMLDGGEHDWEIFDVWSVLFCSLLIFTIYIQGAVVKSLILLLF